VVLTKASASTLASKATGHLKKASTSGHAVTVSVRIVGSKSLAKGKIVITANGKKVRTISLSSASSGKFVVNLPAFSKKFKKVTIQAKFLGTKSLKAAKSKKYVLHLHK
jgi:hypothetical protein